MMFFFKVRKLKRVTSFNHFFCFDFYQLSVCYVSRDWIKVQLCTDESVSVYFSCFLCFHLFIGMSLDL